MSHLGAAIVDAGGRELTLASFLVLIPTNRAGRTVKQEGKEEKENGVDSSRPSPRRP